LGEPIVILTLQDPSTGTRAFLVLDSLVDARGAAGGVRMMPGVTLEEVKRLARAMTYKYGGIGVPSGGAKLGIVGDPADPRKPEILRGIARLIAPLVRADVYRFGQDMGTTTDDIALMYRETGVDPIELGRERAKRFGKSVSLPPGATLATLGGRDFEDTITARGLLEVFREACELIGLDPAGSRVAIQGFGTVGGGSPGFFTNVASGSRRSPTPRGVLRTRAAYPLMCCSPPEARLERSTGPCFLAESRGVRGRGGWRRRLTCWSPRRRPTRLLPRMWTGSERAWSWRLPTSP